MSQDIVDSRTEPWRSSKRLVVAAGIEGELTEQGAVLGDDPDVAVGHQEVDGRAPMLGADPDVVKAAEVAEG